MTHSKKDLRDFFATLFLAGHPLPREVEDDLVRRCAATWIKITKDPVVHFCLELGQHWSGQLKEQPDLCARSVRLILRLQQQYVRYYALPDKRRIYDNLSLAARRLWFSPELESTFWTLETYGNHLRRREELPEPLLRLQSPKMVRTTDATILSFLRWARILIFNLSPLSQRDDCDFGDDDRISKQAYLVGDQVMLEERLKEDLRVEDTTYRGKLARRLQADSALARMQAASTCLEPVALRWLREMEATRLADLSSGVLRHALLWLLELFYGIPARDGFNLGLGPGSDATLGRLTAATIILKLNSAYYPSAECWHSDDLHLPLLSIGSRVLEELWKRFPQATKISDFRADERNVMDAHRRTANEIIFRHLPGWNGKSIRIDRVWLRTAMLTCDLPAAVASVLRAHPLGGARGQCAYIAITHVGVLRSLTAVHRSIYLAAGLEYHAQEFESEEPERLYGKRAMSLKAFSKTTREHILTAETDNEIIACVTRLMHGLGLRKRIELQNPWRLLREEPFPLLEIADKLAGAWSPVRFVPLSPSFLKLIHEIKRIFGDRFYLTYMNDGKEVARDHLSGSEQNRLGEILQDENHYNAGRTALFNALLSLSCGEILRQVLMGHGPGQSHLYGIQLPVPARGILASAREMMLSVCREEGLDACAAALAERLRKLPPRPENDENPIADEAPSQLEERIPSYLHAPMSYEEKSIQDEMYRKFREKSFPSDHSTSKYRGRPKNAWPLSSVGFLGAAALQLRLPFKALLDYQAYYTFESIFYDHHARKIYLLLVMGHHDDGGLSKIPKFICTFDEASTNRLMRLAQYHFNRALIRLRRYEPKTNETHSIGGQKFVRDLLDQRLFGPKTIEKSDVGKGLGWLLPAFNDSRFRPLAAYRLLNRIVKCACVMEYAPLLAGVFCDRNELGLNHYSVQDLFDCRNGARTALKNMVGGSWSETSGRKISLPLDASIAKLKKRMACLTGTHWKEIFQSIPRESRTTEVVVTTPLGRRLSQSQYAALKSQITDLSLADWKKLLKTDGGNRKATFFACLHEFLREMAIPENEVQTLVPRIRKFMRLEGKLTCSKPLRLVSEVDLTKIINQACTIINARFKGRSQNPHNPALRLEMIGMLHLLHRTKLRPNEAWGLFRHALLTVGDRMYAFVPGGKTDNARRMVFCQKFPYLGANSAGTQNSYPINQPLYPGLTVRHRHCQSTTVSLQLALKECSSKHLKIYDLRHLGIIFKIREEIQLRLKTGNFSYAMASLSEQVGHYSPVFTLSTYVGTAIFLFT